MGVRVDIRGWIIDANFAPPAAAWIDIDGRTIPIELTRGRIDVARAYSSHDIGMRHVGFASSIVLPGDIQPGTHTARVIARSSIGGGLYAEHGRSVRIAHPRCSARTLTGSYNDPDARLRVRDTQMADHTMGRGAHTIREESSLHVSGRVGAAQSLHVIAKPTVGSAVAWNIESDSAGAFDATLWIGDLSRGLYELTLCQLDEVETIAIRSCKIEIAGPHYLPPQLTALYTPPLAAVLTFADAGSRMLGHSSDAFINGRPIGVSGWCLDPVSESPPLAVFAEIDDYRAIPLSHHLRDPRPDAHPAFCMCGFGGILDTTSLAPGSHRVRIIAAAVSGAGWYVILDRTIEITSPANALIP